MAEVPHGGPPLPNLLPDGSRLPNCGPRVWMFQNDDNRSEPVAAANAGRASWFQSEALGPAWLRSSFAMSLISYADLAGLRLRDYVEQGADIEVEESGMVGLVGLGGWERVGESYFTWRQGEPYQTAGVHLDLGSGSQLPKAGLETLLNRLGLSVTPGMTQAEVTSAFGSPEISKGGRAAAWLLRFICGEREQYWIGCGVDDKAGLTRLFLARKDYCDEDDAL